MNEIVFIDKNIQLTVPSFYKMKNIRALIKTVELEALMWSAGLVYLVTINPYQVQKFTLCPFHNLGISFCPGCGLGRSIAFLFHGDLINSLSAHPLGIIALIIITSRIIKLTYKSYKNYQTTKEVLYGKYSRVNA